MSTHTVRSYLSDPDLGKLKARKARYAGVCRDCGNPTDGTPGVGKAAERCAECSILFQRRSARWTPTSVVAAMMRWEELFGRPPRASEWRTRSRLADLGIDDVRDWPLTSTVQEVFGSWNGALDAAGLHTLRPGAYPRRNGDRPA